jgi:hypothetical protein
MQLVKIGGDDVFIKAQDQYIREVSYRFNRVSDRRAGSRRLV